MFGLFLGLSAVLIAFALSTTNPSGSGNSVTNAANNLLGLDSDTGDAVWKTEMERNSLEAEKDRLFQREMADLQYQRSLPSTQMQNYRDAGLNPSLMYGQMSDLQTSVPSGAQSSFSGAPTSQLGSLLGLGLDAGMMPAQINLMNAQAAEIRSRIPLNEQRTSNLSAQYNDILASVKQRLADIALKASQTNLNDEQRKNISFDQMFKSNQLAIDYSRLENENSLTAVQVKNIEANTRETLARAAVSERELQEMLYTFAIRKAGLEKQNLLTDAMIAQSNATKAKLEKEGLRIDQLIDIDTPEAINSNGWSDSLLGKRGKLEQVGADISYNFLHILKNIGFVIK